MGRVQHRKERENRMKLLMIKAYPRKNGFTNHCTELFIQGAKEAGASLSEIDLSLCNLNHCRGCYSCWTNPSGKCVLKDDMEGLLQQFLNAETIVFSTPLNAYGVNSHLKIFLDRTFPLTMPGFEMSERGLVRNCLRFPSKWPKTMAAIVVGAFKGEENFSAIRNTFELYANGMNLTNAGIVVRPESFLLQFSLAKPKTVKSIEAALVKAGFELTTNGRISAQILQQASLPLSSDVDHFRQYSNIYWEYAATMGKDSGDLSTLQKRVTSDVRILMHEMACSIDATATARLKAIFQFDFPDKDFFFTFAVDKGRCSLSEGKAATPDLRVTCSTETWADIFVNRASVRDALLTHKIALEGDKSLFVRLDRFFPPPDR
jgi:multimeric flavodoxin WrbA/putative sterol carrier protein